MTSRTLCRAAGSAALAMAIGTSLVAQQSLVSLNLYSLGSFYYEMPRPADIKAKKPFKSSIPPAIKAHDGRKVAIDGFMVPYDMTTNMVNQFMLVASYDACGFGDMPARVNDFVDVSVRGKGAFFTDSEITVTGTLSVGEQFDTEGFLVSIYRLDAEAVR